jgi:hypothetical protein
MFAFPLIVRTPSVKFQLRLPLVPLSAYKVAVPAKRAKKKVKSFLIIFIPYYILFI